MSIKKCVNGSFVNDFYKEYGTDTDTITSLPKTIIGDGQPISSYTIKGNMTQSGTPTPSNPIYPTECGEKTANLFDKDRTQGIIASAYINQSGQQVSSQSYYISYPIAVSEGETYTWSFVSFSGAYHTAPTLAFYDANDEMIGVASHSASIAHFTFTVPNNTKYIRASVYTGFSQNSNMLLEGSTTTPDGTPLDYIPYGYKIPISFGQNTYNIYISEPLRKSLDGSNVYDTIESNGTLTRRVDENGDALATPTTEQVTVPTLTTTGTPEQFNVLTTLAPSEVSLTYHGWHEHSDTKYSNP